MRCPGQDTRYWKPGDIFEAECPKCGQQVEFFKDEPSRRCKKCGHRFVNPKMDFGCAAYCKFAEQCLGTLGPEILIQREELFKNRVALEMKQYFKKDFKRIAHAVKVAQYAEQIAKGEKGDLAVVLSAAYLLDMGIKEETGKKSGQAKSPSQKGNEGPTIARKILTRLSANQKLIEEICDIIGRHREPGTKESVNSKAVYDADLIVRMEERQKNTTINHPEELDSYINKAFLTESGRNLAREILLHEENR